MDNRQALYSIEQGDDIRYYKAAKEYSIGDILNIANGETPYIKLMGMGEQISTDKYAAIQQSDTFTFSVEMNFDKGTADIYTVNSGKGGIAEDDRTDENVSFISGELSSVMSKIRNPYNETNFRIHSTDNDTYVVKSDSKRFGNNEIVFESSKRDECVAYISQRKPPLDWKPYVIEDLRSWADPSAVPKRSQIEYFDTIEDALKRFNDLRNMPYNAEKALNTQTGQPMARLTLGMSSSNLAVDILHVRDNKNYLVQDFALMPEMNTDRNFLDTLAKVTAEVGFERIIAHQRDENTGKYIGEPKDLPLNEWENPYFQKGTQIDYIIQSIRVEKAVKPQVEKAFAAEREDRKNTMNTKMECTGMVMLADDGSRPQGSKAKAVATVTVNDEFVLKGIKVYEGENGLFASMPSRKVGNDYQEVIFPITKEAREQLNNTVLESYGKLVKSGLDKLQFEERKAPEQSVSKIAVSLHPIDDEKTKAVGQIVIDDNIVIAGVKVRHGTNADGVEKDFVSMPSYQTQTGDYNEYAHAVTKECYEKINKAVMGAYETLCKTEYKGVQLAELGSKGDVSSKYGMNNAFAEKLMAELEKKGIPYSARVAETTALSVKNTDRAAVDSIQKALSADLKTAKQPEQKHNKPKPKR